MKLGNKKSRTGRITVRRVKPGQKPTLLAFIFGSLGVLLLVFSAICYYFIYREQVENTEQKSRSFQDELFIQSIPDHMQNIISGISPNAFSILKDGKDAFELHLQQNLRRTGSSTESKKIVSDVNTEWQPLKGKLEQFIGLEENVSGFNNKMDNMKQRVEEVDANIAKIINSLDNTQAAAGMLQNYLRGTSTNIKGLIESIQAGIADRKENEWFETRVQQKVARAQSFFERYKVNVDNRGAGIFVVPISEIATLQTSVDTHLTELYNFIQTVTESYANIQKMEVLKTEAGAETIKLVQSLVRYRNSFESDVPAFRLFGVSINLNIIRILLIIGTVLIALSVFFLILRFRVMVVESQRLQEESEFKGRRDQEAILRLMDELGELSDGDLTVQAQVTEDFTGAIADSVNFAIESMREMVGTINRTSSQVSDASAQTKYIANEMRLSSTEQAEKIRGVSQVIGNMVHSLDQVAKSTADSAEIARNSVSFAQAGSKQVTSTINGMNTIRENIQETSKRIKRLGESSQEIGNIVEIIKGIADQTNILALNAAIQATSAGEAGRGFAVVADEVQRLAERSANATKRIEALVKTIQTDTNEAIASMENSTREVVSGAEIAEEAGKALLRIENVSSSLASLIERVSSSTKKVSGMADFVAENMNQINDITENTTQNVVKTSAAIENLELLSLELKNSVSGFKLPEGY